MKILSLKLVILLEYQNIKTILQKAMFQIAQKVKNNVPWTYVISDQRGEEIVGTFYEKELQKRKSKRV